MSDVKRIPYIRWEGAGYDVRKTAAKKREDFVKQAPAGKADSFGLLWDKCIALVAAADAAPVAEAPAPTADPAAKTKKSKTDDPTI